MNAAPRSRVINFRLTEKCYETIDAARGTSIADKIDGIVFDYRNELDRRINELSRLDAEIKEKREVLQVYRKKFEQNRNVSDRLLALSAQIALAESMYDEELHQEEQLEYDLGLIDM